MKKFFFIIFSFLIVGFLSAQTFNPVSWSFNSKKIAENLYEIQMIAIVQQGWHVYSQTVKDGGPIKTSFTFTPSKDYSTIGSTIEPKPISKMEKVFNMEVGFFEKSVIFQQKIKLNTGQTTVKGTLEYMTCNDHQCLPPDDIEFSIPVK